MKINHIKTLSSLILTLMMLTFSSCGGGEQAPNPNQDAVRPNAKGAEANRPLVIRYVDGDSITANYNFAKDIQDAMLKAQSRQESAERQRASQIQQFAQQVQAEGSRIDSKMRSGGYLSEVSQQSDQKKYEDMLKRGDRMQQEAQTYLSELARNSQNEIMQLQIQLNDSIESFIKAYNAQHHYDAILYKAAGIYFDPSLDITNEVIKGLNARYNKVSSK